VTKRYIEGWDQRQNFLLPECLDDYVDENNPVRVIEAGLPRLGVSGVIG
jgi:transposase